MDFINFEKTLKKTQIDKIYACQKLIQRRIQVITKDSIENTGDDKSLGHKLLLILIEEKSQTKIERSIIVKSKFAKEIAYEFRDSEYHNLVRLIKNKNFKDPASEIMLKLKKAAENSTKIIQKSAIIQLKDLEKYSSDNSTKSTKKFCRFYKHIQAFRGTPGPRAGPWPTKTLLIICICFL